MLHYTKLRVALRIQPLSLGARGLSGTVAPNSLGLAEAGGTSFSCVAVSYLHNQWFSVLHR